MEHIFGINNSSPRFLPCDTSMSQSPHAALSHYQCGDNYPPKMRTNWLFIKARASFSLRPLVPGMRRSSVAVLVLLPLATTTLPLNPDHNDSTPHPLIPPRMRKGYSTFRVRPRILKGLKRTFSKTENTHTIKVLCTASRNKHTYSIMNFYFKHCQTLTRNC